MYEYISGKVVELNPAYAVVDVAGVAYHLQISLNTFEKASASKLNTFFVYLSIKEDAHTLYGFADKKERELFKLLISVSGVGTNTARIMLSSLNTQELINAIATEDVLQIKSVKGIGPKTAQRVVIDLKDKVITLGSETEIFTPSNNRTQEEALSALVALGFSKISVNKVIAKILKNDSTLTVEEIIKTALKQL